MKNIAYQVGFPLYTQIINRFAELFVLDFINSTFYSEGFALQERSMWLSKNHMKDQICEIIK